MSALQAELLAALASPQGRALLRELFDEAVGAAVDRMPQPIDGDQLLTIEAAALLRGCSASALRKQIQRGRVPSVKTGHLVRVRRRDAVGGGE